ncbi:MAG: biotin--[acetyl-CoA-carboxylase] ligase [Dehalococcoidia bacterium]|nr:MAG: biotin--[acetyl-CoA-carboxylase] ligase [Dehalococcoidia bacterium]
MGSDLSLDAIKQGLTTRLVGSNLIYYPSVSSTQDIAREAAVKGAHEGTTIVAEEQTKGRARLGRTWINPPGVVAVSIILHPEMSQLTRLTVMASLATSQCIEKATGLKTSIKWPNDVLINGKKVSGILIESALRGQAVDWAVVGIGININFDPKSFPEIADIATSLSAELGREVSQLQVLLHLLDEMEQLYMALREGHSIHEEWRSRLETLGKQVEVTFGDHMEVGCAESVDDDGSLLLRRSDGTLISIIAGDVSLRAQ